MVEKIENYTKPATVNPWIAELAGFQPGEAFAETITPNKRAVKDDNGEPTGEFTYSIAGTKSRIQDAARANGLTARVAEEKENEDGTVRVVFVLSPAQKSGPRKAAQDAPADKVAGKGK